MPQFKTTNLVGDRVLVQGTDFLGTEGKVVLDSSQWTELNKHKQWESATQEFDAAVEAFFAPISEAADKVKAQTKTERDPVSFVVLEEETKGVQAKPAHVVSLTKDSQILRIIESGDHDRLAWVGDDLEILAASQTPALPLASQPSAAEVGAEATGLPLED